MPASQRTVRTKVPQGFDPNNGANIAKLTEFVRSRLSNPELTYSGFDKDTRHALFSEPIDVESSDAGDWTNLPDSVKPSDAQSQATLLKQMWEGNPDRGPGWVMVEFDPWAHKARMAFLSGDEQRARSAIANAMGCKGPWEVQVKALDKARTAAKGFDVHLPRTYVASKHDTKIDEAVTTIIGRPGWWFKVDPATLVLQIRPGELPTFPKAIPFPFEDEIPRFTLANRDWTRLPLGRRLPDRGVKGLGEEFYLDLAAGPHTQLGGTSNSGKSVTINAGIYGMLMRGALLVIVDTPSKAVDFEWAKPYCAPGMGWGCDSLEQSVAALKLVIEEADRRAKVLKKEHVNNWFSLPRSYDESFRPLYVVIDEVTSLFIMDEEPKFLPKDHPMRVEAQENNLKKTVRKTAIKRMLAEYRFVGVFVELSSQVASANTGIGPDMRTNLQQKILMGPNASRQQRGMVFSTPELVPSVPDNVRSAGAVAKGTGSAELEGQGPCVFKGYFADVNEYGKRLRQAGVPTTDAPEPSAADIARLNPSIDDEGDSYEPETEGGLEPAGFTEGFGDPGGDPGDELKGAAAASHALAMSAALMKKKRAQAAASAE